MSSYNGQITMGLLEVGCALLGQTVTGEPLPYRQQHTILDNATLPQLVAAKVIIQKHHSTDIYALLSVDCYLAAKSRNTVQPLVLAS